MSHPCPKCAVKAKCVNSRHRADETVHRRFVCEACECRFSSVEVIVSIDGAPCSVQLNDSPRSNSKRLKSMTQRRVSPGQDPIDLMQALLNEIVKARQ